MSYSTTRYGRQSVLSDESLVSYVQDLRFDVSDSGTESYLGLDEATYSDRNEATYSDHNQATYLDHNEATYSDRNEATYSDRNEATYSDHNQATYLDHNQATYSDRNEATYSDHNQATYLDHNEATYSDHNEATYSDHDEETDSRDGGQDDPRCYGICPGKLAPNTISNKGYRCGNDNFDYIKAYWPETIPRHHTWIGKHPVDERFVLAHVEEEIGIKLKDMLDHGRWVPWTEICKQRIAPYIATITYSDSNPLVTLSYALLREPSGKVIVVGFKLCLAEQNNPTHISQLYLVKLSGGQGGSTNTRDFLGFQTPATPRIHERSPMYWDCKWWVPDRIAREVGFNIHFHQNEVAERSTPS